MQTCAYVMVYGLLLCYTEVASGFPCTSQLSNPVRLSISSQRNQTGHWNAQVQLKHEAGPEQTGPWNLNVDHSTGKCNDTESVHIVATLTGPSQNTTEKLKITRQPPGPGYELIPGLGYYKFHSDLKTWHQARDTCIMEGAHLTIINSQREANALLHFWVPYPKLFSDWRNDWAHIGFHDQYVEGEYVTIFDEPLDSTGYTKWHPGQPNAIVTENCGVANRPASSLADVGCGVQLPFFCEQELDHLAH